MTEETKDTEALMHVKAMLRDESKKEYYLTEHIGDISDEDGLAFIATKIFPFSVEIEDVRRKKKWMFTIPFMCAAIEEMEEREAAKEEREATAAKLMQSHTKETIKCAQCDDEFPGNEIVQYGMCAPCARTWIPGIDFPE